MKNQPSFTLPKLRRLQEAYSAAVSHKKVSFMFDGKEYLTEYAKHLIEYLAVVLVLISGQHLQRS